MNEWISVKDRLPEALGLYDDVLVYTGVVTIGTYRTDNEGNKWWVDALDDECRPTHWMPLPDPPDFDMNERSASAVALDAEHKSYEDPKNNETFYGEKR